MTYGGHEPDPGTGGLPRSWAIDAMRPEALPSTNEMAAEVPFPVVWLYVTVATVGEITSRNGLAETTIMIATDTSPFTTPSAADRTGTVAVYVPSFRVRALADNVRTAGATVVSSDAESQPDGAPAP